MLQKFARAGNFAPHSGQNLLPGLIDEDFSSSASSASAAHKSSLTVLDKCHKQRNLAEYEGNLEITPQLLQELIEVTKELVTLVEALGPIKRV